MWELQGRGTFGTWGWGRLCALPAAEIPGCGAGPCGPDRALQPCLVSSWTSSLFVPFLVPLPCMWSHNLMHVRDAMLRSRTRADLCSRPYDILAVLGSGHLVTVHQIVWQH